MELKKNGVREKSLLGILVFRHPCCSSSHSNDFNAEHENTCPFPCHLGRSIPTFQEMYLHSIVRNKLF